MDLRHLYNLGNKPGISDIYILATGNGVQDGTVRTYADLKTHGVSVTLPKRSSRTVTLV